MRMVYMQEPGMRFRPDVEKVSKLLPEVVSIVMTFAQPTSTELLMTDLALSADYTFRNGKALHINGVLLWKFLDIVPESLGSDEHGYDDKNVYGEGTTEFLMRRIRAAYQAMLVDEGFSMDTRPPLRATLDLDNLKVEAIYPAEMDDALYARLFGHLEPIIPGLKVRVLMETKDIIREALKNKRAELQRYDSGNGMIGSRFVEFDWPKNVLDTMTFGEFVKQNAPDDGSNWLRGYDTIIVKEIETYANKLFVGGLHLAGSDGMLLNQIGEALRFDVGANNTFNEDEATKALWLSRNGETFMDLLWGGAHFAGSKEMLLGKYLEF